MRTIKPFAAGWPISLLLLVLLLLPSCVFMEYDPPRPEPLPEAEPEPVLAPASPSVPLLADARQALARNDLAGAESYLERAIRMEPRNPLLWHAMAQTKYRQGEYAQAVQFALRSNSLLPRESPLARDNFRLMALAYRHLGQEEKARRAEEHL